MNVDVCFELLNPYIMCLLVIGARVIFCGSESRGDIETPDSLERLTECSVQPVDG